MASGRGAEPADKMTGRFLGFARDQRVAGGPGSFASSLASTSGGPEGQAPEGQSLFFWEHNAHER